MDLQKLNQMVNEDWQRSHAIPPSEYSGEVPQLRFFAIRKPMEKRLPDSALIITFGVSSFLLGLIIGWILH